MKLTKRIISFILAAVMLLSVPGVLFAASDSTVYVKKHVSILCDDSGSMRSHLDGGPNLKWCYSSYAVQVFTGLLNDTDTLSISMMNGKNTNNSGDTFAVDLKGDRQRAVDLVRDKTSWIYGNTPIGSIGRALKVLTDQGLKKGSGANEPGEQFWLVLTTDGRFTEGSGNILVDKGEVVSEFLSILEDYPDLNLVYFGIGAENDDSDECAWDFREGSSDPNEQPGSKPHSQYVQELNSHHNFTAVYSDTQAGMITTMQGLSNRISGRYSVTEDCTVNGNEVTMYLSSEGSPMRNIALLAQNTDAQLVSAETEDGTRLEINRSAKVRYPDYNPNYFSNMPEGTLGGYAALVTGKGGEKIPSGTIKLTFSEPVTKEDLSLMYEPAIYVRLNVEKKNQNGEWVPVADSATLVEGDEIRVNYDVCEDGTGRVLDIDKLFGRNEATLLFNGRQIEAGESVTVQKGDSVLDIRISMMDGGYQISRTRIIRTTEPGAANFTTASSGPIELRRAEAAQNETKHIDFTVSFNGEPLSDEYMSKMRVEATGEGKTKLSGSTEVLPGGIVRFTPRDENCKAGEYVVKLFYDRDELITEFVTILPNETTFTAQAGKSVSILSNNVADNEEFVTFTVIAHRDEGEGPITEEEAKLFRVVPDGSFVNGVIGYMDGGVITFTLKDPSAVPGEYPVSLWKDDQKLASTYFTVIRYDATYTVETVVSDPNDIDRYRLHENEKSVSFIVYEDGVPVPASQLNAMLDEQIIITSSRTSKLMKLDIKTGTVNGKPALVVTPVSSTRSAFVRFFHHIAMSIGSLHIGDLDIGIKVDTLHGCEDSGTLRLTGYRVWPIVLLIALGALLVLAGFLIFSNLAAVRFKKGKLWGFSVSVSKNGPVLQYHVNNLSSRKIGKNFRLMLAPVPEKADHKGMKFEAKRRENGPKVLQTSLPEAKISCRAADAGKYFKCDPKTSRTNVINMICTTRPRTISADQFETLLSGSNLVHRADSSETPTQTVHFGQTMQSNGVLYKDVSQPGFMRYQFWIYRKRR